MKIDGYYAVQSQKYMKTNKKKKEEAAEKLSSGYKINKAADDAAGLSLSEDMRRQIRGLDRASLNSQEGISAMQIADGAMAEVQEMLNRGLELCIESANGTHSDSDRKMLQDEVEQIKTEIDAIAERTYYNELQVLKGQGKTGTISKANEKMQESYNVEESTLYGSGKSISIQACSETGEMVPIELPFLSCGKIGVDDVDIGTADGAVDGIDKFKSASAYVSGERSRCGAYQNRLEHSIDNVDNTAENMTASESRIRDADLAIEQMKFTKNSIITQASQAILAQANQSYQGVVNLLTFE